MKTIPLSHGKVAYISDEDMDATKQFKWRYSLNSGYCLYHFSQDGKKRTMFLHRFIYAKSLGHSLPKGFFVDHIDGNKLNCCRENLRLASPSENSWNQSKSSNSNSVFKGVSFKNGKYEASIRYYYKGIYLGRFLNAEEAALMYDAAAKTLFKEFAKLNFPEANIPTGISERLEQILAKKNIQP